MAYMLEKRLCNYSFIEIEKKLCGKASFFFSLAFSIIFLHFLTDQTPFENDFSEDEWLKPPFSRSKRHWAREPKPMKGFS